MEADLFAVLFQRRRRDHRRGRVGQDIDERGERLLQGNFYRRRIERFSTGDIFIQVVALEMIIRIAGAIEVGLHRLGIKVGAILELHPGMEFDGVNQSVRRDGVTLRQHVLQLHLFIQTKQPLIERFGDGLGQGVIGIIRVEGREVRADRDDHIFRGKSRACRQR